MGNNFCFADNLLLRAVTEFYSVAMPDFQSQQML